MNALAMSAAIAVSGLVLAGDSLACELGRLTTADKVIDVVVNIKSGCVGKGEARAFFTGETLALQIHLVPRGKSEFVASVASVGFQRDDGLRSSSEPRVRKLEDGTFFADNLELAAPGAWIISINTSVGEREQVVETTVPVALNPKQAAEALANTSRVPDFALKDPRGRTVTRADMLGKVWLASFFFTACPEVCPLMSQKLASVQRQFKGDADFRVVSVTTDPGSDTPSVIAAFAARHDADESRWLFLTGDKGAIVALSDDGLKLGVTKDSPMHSTRIAVVDRDGYIKGMYDSTKVEELEQLKIVVRELLAKSPRGKAH